jgi:hypothetical protein
MRFPQIPQFALHAIELSLRPVELDLPVLCAPVVLPKEEAALSSAALRVAILSFWASISLLRTALRAERAPTDLSFFYQTGGDQLHLTAQHLKTLIDVRKRLFDSRFALEPIFKPKLSAMPPHLLKGHKKEPVFSLIGDKKKHLLIYSADALSFLSGLLFIWHTEVIRYA